MCTSFSKITLEQLVVEPLHLQAMDITDLFIIISGQKKHSLTYLSTTGDKCSNATLISGFLSKPEFFSSFSNLWKYFPPRRAVSIYPESYSPESSSITPYMKKIPQYTLIQKVDSIRLKFVVRNIVSKPF
jgi:hypothetical protein